MADDLDALFGTSQDFVNDLVSQAKQEQNELARIEPQTPVQIDNLQEHILKKADSMLDKARDAVEGVLACVEAEPTNAEIINAASTMMGSYTKLLDQLNKMSAVNEKFRQQKELMRMKIESDQRINQENNETALLMHRDELMGAIMQARSVAPNPSQIIDDTINPQAH